MGFYVSLPTHTQCVTHCSYSLRVLLEDSAVL